MNKMTIGRPRKKSTDRLPATVDAQSSRRRTADAVMIFGAAAVCGMLALPLRAMPSPEERTLPSEETAVMVMSQAVGTAVKPEKEEVIAPSNADEEEWNFYDYIGELFAGLISGQ